jgi:hypothetical protein
MSDDLINQFFPKPSEGKTYTEEELIQYVADYVSDMLDREPDLLFSTLYRLDVDEHKIKKALLASEEPGNIALAKLILKRQKQRVEARKKYKSPPLDNW